jgi:hypothetical protein
MEVADVQIREAGSCNCVGVGRRVFGVGWTHGVDPDDLGCGPFDNR